MIDVEKLKSFFRLRLTKPKQEHSRSSIELYAYQESARIVTAYAFGYRCQRDGLRKPGTCGSRTELDFKNHTFIINALTSYSGQPHLLDSLTKDNPCIPRDLTDKLCMIFLSGWVARRIRKRTASASQEVEIGPADAGDLDNIEQFLKSQPYFCANDRREVLIAHTEQFVKIASVWHAVETTAKSLIRSSQGINREQVEYILRRCPFWQFIKG